MAYALRPPEPLPQNPPLMASIGVSFDAAFNWHQEFNAHLDAFLSAARSVPDLMRRCFGDDVENRKMRAWFNGLDVGEQQRRRQFEEKFKPDYKSFCDLPLGAARHISEHRTGYAPVTVAISSRFGVIYAGDPTTCLPIAEPPASQLTYGGMPSAIPLKPRWTDFHINGGSLFDACRSYLDCAQTLIDRARELANEVHGDSELTRPPSPL